EQVSSDLLSFGAVLRCRPDFSSREALAMHLRRLILALWSLGCAALAGGCSDASSPAAAKNLPPAARNDHTPITVQVVKNKEFLKALEAHRGKVVLVDFWATWCAPCKAKFPKVVHLHEQYRDKGLVCVSVSLDEPGKESRALEFLQEQHAAFPNYLMAD